jgi:hypothetical protein
MANQTRRRVLAMTKRRPVLKKSPRHTKSLLTQSQELLLVPSPRMARRSAKSAATAAKPRTLKLLPPRCCLMARSKIASARIWSRPNLAQEKTRLTSASDNSSQRLNILWGKFQQSKISKVPDCQCQDSILALNTSSLSLTPNTRHLCIHTPSTVTNRLWDITWPRPR